MIRDDYTLHRSTGEQSSTSINFSTKKISETIGGNEFNEDENRPKTVWKSVKPYKLLSLGTLTEDTIDEYLNKINP